MLIVTELGDICHNVIFSKLVLFATHVYPAKNYWAKDLIFLVTSQNEVGMQAWIDGYIGTHSSGKTVK